MLKSALRQKYDVKEYNPSNKENAKANKVIIVFHGIYGKFVDLDYISNELSKDGYKIISIQYPTTEENIEQISVKYIEPVINTIDSEKEKYFIVHSMGGIVLREYLLKNKVENLRKVVFISPPSSGSSIVDTLPAKLLKRGLGEALSDFSTKDDSFLKKLPKPDYDCKVLIGNRSNNFLYSAMIKGKDDGMVPVYGAKIEGCPFNIIDGTTHTSILKDKRTLNEIKEYIEKD